jgi:mitochondrial fission protein ELM1
MGEHSNGALRPTPECIVLPVREGVTPSSKPPVRIYVGTEPAQFRPEMVLVWSIEQVRDPSRSYEIYLMKDLAGYRKYFWTTSFTNYRFAIAHYAGARGRAIYNDEDQIYLGDPGELFDADMGDHGYLTISDRDTAVMLIDCEKMADVWTLEGAQRRRKHALLDAGVKSGLCGPLPSEWHARDEPEYVEGHTKLLHYTTLHTQPWRPFPEVFVYRDHPLGHLWHDREKEAQRAGFSVFTRERPSSFWKDCLAALEEPREPAPPNEPRVDDAIRDLVRRAKARSLLQVAAGARAEVLSNPERWDTQHVAKRGYDVLLHDAPSEAKADGVACLSGLEEIPSDDIAWLIAELFERAEQFVFATVRCHEGPPPKHWITPPEGTVHTPDWWAEQFSAAAMRHPNLHWELLIVRGASDEPGRIEIRQGGRFLGDALPRVWVLTDGKPGHTTQSVGLAEELGWPYERVDLRFNPIADLPNQLIGASRLGLWPGSARSLSPPWPDLVIAAGRRPAPVARWIRERSSARTRAVHLGRMGGTPPEAFDLGVVPSYARLLPHPRRTEIALPPTRVRGNELDDAADRWVNRFTSQPQPRIALLVGGNTPHYRFTPELALELGLRITALADAVGGSVFATTSRRTPRAAARALEQALPDAAHFYRWKRRGRSENPYLGYLALADAFVVTGESASMLAEACATGKPVYIYDLPRGVPGWRGIGSRALERLREAVVRGSDNRPKSRRGITRPQKRFELFFSKLLQRGWVVPPCDFSLLHEALIQRGMARPFDELVPGASTPEFQPRRDSDLPQVADCVREILGVQEP